MNTSEKYAFVSKKASGILGCIRQSITRRLREVILPIYSTLVRTYLECCAQSCTPQNKRDQERHGHQRDMKIMKRLEHLSYKERLRETGLFSLEKRSLRADFVDVYKHLMGRCKEDGDVIFIGAPGQEAMGKN